MASTAAERAKKYRDRLKQNKTKYLEFKRKDCERKARKQVLMNKHERDNHRDKHRMAQQRYRRKLKAKANDKTQSSCPYGKHTLAKAVKKVMRVLPNDKNKQCTIVKRIGQDLGMFEKPKLKRTQTHIPESTIKKVEDFYKKDAISYQAPGKRDFVTIRENGVRVKHQKRYLLYNIREIHQLFIQEHPGTSISPSSFANLRPKYIRYKSTLPHRVCVCVVHENVNLLLDVLSKEIHGLKNSLSDYLLKMVCDESQERCMMSNCNICENYFKQRIMKNIIDKRKVIEWYQWTNNNGRADKRMFSGSVLKCVKQLQSKTAQYLWHVYIKRKQSNYFEHIKENAGDQIVVCQVDYAENFSIDHQNQIQSAHWSKKSISIFTAYVWFGGSGGEGQSFGLVSNSPKHDKYTVITCLKILIKEIISSMPDVNEIIFFSDNASSQFKNRYIISHLTTMMDEMGVEFSWNYFAASHGKGVVDGVGGILKRLVWLEIMAGNQCSSAEDFVKICREKTKSISVIFVEQTQFDLTKSLLDKTFAEISSFCGIQRQHHFKVLHKNVIEYARYSTSDEKYVFRF